MPSKTNLNHGLPSAVGKPETLDEVLQAFIDRDETITYRAIARTLCIAPSSVTRSADRRLTIDAFIEQQRSLRQWQERNSKTSKSVVARKLAEKDGQIAAYEKQVAILTASHKAMIFAIGEKGGMVAWKEFFKEYRNALEDIGQE